jgi:diaminohydroxyphosphoribosylaminopyrimidine deaminase/5-amino-6-(5-phosphoribosylamino)uracil reductase
MNEHDIRFMQHALDFARKGVGLASPNPTVGCVIVRDGKIVGEGFHHYDKRDHAEIVALNMAGGNARGATAYVTLEPCNHIGRTGPCTAALMNAEISRVVVAAQDPNPKVSGSGSETLRASNVVVETGICQAEAQRLNHAFACWIRTGRPFVTLKSALTLDGQLALKNQGTSKKRNWITSEESRAEVQRLRHASDALLTGIGTILADDPLLTDRSNLPRRRRLLRVIVDSNLRLSPKARIVKSAEQDLLVFTAASLRSTKARKLQNAGVELVNAPSAKGKRGQLDLKSVLRELGRRELLHVLLEAGPRLNGSALAANLVDRLFLFYAPKIARRIDKPFVAGPAVAELKFHDKTLREFGPDFAVDALVRNYFDL